MDALDQRTEAVEGVEQRPVPGGFDEGTIVVLAVDLDQGLPHLFQQLHADGGVVDQRAGAAVGALHPPQDQGVAPLDAVGGKEGKDGMAGAGLEDGGHLALGRALAHERGIAPGADGQRKGIEQDRLAGAGLAGEHGEAGLEFEIELIDQDDVADRQGG